MIRRCLLPVVLFFVAAFASQPLHAQSQDSSGSRQPSEETETRNEPDFKWHLVNTAIFFALVGYGIAKAGPGFFNARSEDIKRAIQEATGLKLQAEFRSSEIDRKMATLPQAVEQMRATAKAAMDRESERRQAETAEAIARIRKAAEGEIANMRLQEARQIRRRAARVAFKIAEQRLREQARTTGNTDFVNDFVNLVGHGTSGSAR